MAWYITVPYGTLPYGTVSYRPHHHSEKRKPLAELNYSTISLNCLKGRGTSMRVHRLVLLLAALPYAWRRGTFLLAQQNASILAPMTKFQANPDCPCLSQKDVVARVQAANASRADAVIGGSCPDNLLPSTAMKSTGPSLSCLPAELGSEVCRAWDSVLLEVRHLPHDNYFREN